MMLRSVTSRLVLSYCLLLVLLGAAFLAFTVLSFTFHMRETLVGILANRAGNVWSVSENLLDQPQRLAEVIERSYTPEAQNRFIRVRSGDRVLYSSGPPVDGTFDPRVAPKVSPAGAKEDFEAGVHGDLLLYSRNFQTRTGAIVTIDAGQSYAFVRSLEARLATSLLIALPILLILAALAGYVLMRRALTPVEVMINAAESYSFKDPHKRLPMPDNEPRIEALGLALNRMLDRLDAAYSHVSRFSADAAHELRTPLTIIRGELEMVASGEKLPAHVEQAIANALEEITRISEMVGDLITLSWMESMPGKLSREAVDLRALAVETIDQMHLLAEEKQIDLSPPQGAAVIVAADRNRLKQVLVNLIDNAIKYTPVRGRVSVETGIAGAMGFAEVKDSGIGIDAKLHERIFDQFFRVSPDRGGIGAGLGLAIVRSISHAHGGSVSLRSTPKAGSCFRIEIPLFLASVKRDRNAHIPAAMVEPAGP